MIRRLLELLHLTKPRQPRLQQTDVSGIAWEQKLIGKNIHSVFTWCKDCHSEGVNIPLNDECGNCGSKNTVRYYDKETIDLLF
jgi:rRNA maturation endonuclease Nob1